MRNSRVLSWQKLGVVASAIGGTMAAGACLPGARVIDAGDPPAAASARAGGPTLGGGFESAEVTAARQGAVVSGPFRVLFAGPEGDDLDTPQPQIVFSRPVRALGATTPPELKATFSPPVPGHWEWVGTSAARFVPDAGFAAATTYRLEVAPGLRSVSGDTLTETTRLVFSTQRPAVSLSSSFGGEADLDEAPRAAGPREPITLYFRGGVRRHGLEAHMRVVSRSGTTLPFRLETEHERKGPRRSSPEDDIATELRLVPLGIDGWPEDDLVTVRFDGQIKGAPDAGPLPMRPTELRFSTSEPPHVQTISCSETGEGRCQSSGDPEYRGRVTVELSDPMRAADLFALVSVEPRVKLEQPDRKDDHPRTWHQLAFAAEPNVRYTVRIRPSAGRPRQDPKKTATVLLPLKIGKEASFVFSPEETGARFSFSGTYLLPGSGPEHDELAAKAEDTTSARAFVLPMTRDLAMAAERADLEGQSRQERAPAADDGPFFWEKAPAKSKVLTIRASQKEPPTWLSLEGEMPSVRTMPVLFGARWKGFDREQHTSQVLQTTELAMVTRTSPEETLVWITSLRTGEPLGNVAVEGRDFFGHSVKGTTDADGVVRLDTSTFGGVPDEHEPGDMLRRRVVVFAQRGDDWMYERVFIPEKPALKAGVFTDRGLYRPGETTRLFGVIRRPTARGLEPEVDKSVDLTVHTPEGRTLHTTGRLGAYGTYSAEIQNPADAPLGFYQVSASLGAELASYASYRVMEYKPSSFSLTGTFDKSMYQRGDVASCRAQGSYLYGGSLKDAKVDFHIRRSTATFTLPNLPSFSVMPREHDRLPDGLAHSTTLDERGTAAFATPLENTTQLGPELITCELVATDAGHDTVGATASAIVHPAAMYAAIESAYRGLIAPGQRIAPNVLAVRPDGTRVRHPVKLSLFVVRRDPKRPWQTLPLDATPASTCEAHPGDTPATCVLTSPAGPYDSVARFELRASVVDDEGREARATEYLYPGTPPRVRRPSTSTPQPRATLVADKISYALGEKAELTATSPFAKGHMLLTVESAGISRHFVRPIGESPASFELPVDDSVTPEVHAEMTVVAPFDDTTLSTRTSSASALVKSPYESRALSVTITPNKAIALPGEEIDLDVEVRKSDGSPADASVTLYGADEGTLLLAKYAVPEPLGSFFHFRAHTVSGENTRYSLASLHDWKEELRQFGLGNIGTIGHGAGTGFGEGFGSGGGRLGGASTNRRGDPRRDMRQSAFFFPGLTTDAQGHVKRRVRLPDSVTTFRLMALAVTKPGDIGSGKAPVVTQMPMQVRPSMPRVVRLGDRLQIAAMVANNDASAARLGARDCVVSVAIDGKTLVARGPTSHPVSLAAGASARLTFDVEAVAPSVPEAGSAGVVTTSLQCGELGDAAESPYTVVAPMVLDAASAFGETKGRVDQPLASLDDVNKSVGGLDLTLSTSPLAGLGTGLEQLVDYPYGCVEQTTSRLVPLLSLRELGRALNVKLPDDVDTATRAAVAKIEAAQQKDGGFGLWPDSESSSPWLSAYATWGLEEARRHYVPANDAALDRARQHLLEGLAATGDSSAERAAAPFSLDVLAGASVSSPGSVDPGSLRVIADQWFDRRDRLPVFSRALLLHAMATLEADPVRLTKLAEELAAEIHIDGPVARYVTTDAFDEASFDSGVRTSALVLRALLAAAPRHPLLTPLALGLVADRKGGTWRTTHETAWALLALDAYRQQHDAEGASPLVGGLVKLDGGPLLQAEFAAIPGTIPPDVRATIPLAKLLESKGTGTSRNLSFEALGAGEAPLFYQAVLRTAPAKLPTEGRSSGFEIHRTYQVVPSGAASQLEAYKQIARTPPEQPIREGDLVLVTLDIVATSRRRFVVVDDALPGGFETVDPSLQGGPRWLRGVLSHSGGGVTRVEHRDDRTLFFLDDLPPGGRRLVHLVRATSAGTFVTPPARVEEMYSPETSGRTGARSVEIAARP